MFSSYFDFEDTDSESASLLPIFKSPRSQPALTLTDHVSSSLAEALPASLCNALGQAMLAIPLFMAARIGETELVVTCLASAILMFLLQPVTHALAVRSVVYQGSFGSTCGLSLFMALLMGLSSLFRPVFTILLRDSRAADLAAAYLRLYSPAIPAFALFVYLRAFAVEGKAFFDIVLHLEFIATVC